MREMNVLFTSGGRRVALIRAFREALSHLGLPGKLVCAELRELAAANYVVDAFEPVPRVNEPGYVERLMAICRQHRIRLVVPLIDTELHLLSPHRAAFAAEGIELLVCDTATNDICFDKRRTGDFFSRLGLKTPRIYSASEWERLPASAFPVIVKPASGSCSIGLHRVQNSEELAFFARYVPGAIVQECIRGREYTVDVFTWDGEVLCAVPRERIETRAGEISKGRTTRNRAIMEATSRVVAALPGARGCITVQCFLTESDAEPIFIEINPRFGGGIPLTIESGAHYPEWILRLLSQDVPAAQRALWKDSWTDGMVMLRYDDAVYVPPGNPA